MTTSKRARERALVDILQMTEQVLRCRDPGQSRQVALTHLRRLFNATGAVFVVPGRSVPLGPDDAVVDGAVTDLPSVYGHYLHEDPGLPLLQRARLQCRPLVLTSQMFAASRLLRTRYYSEVMRPRAMHHAMALLLAADRRPEGVIAVYRSHEQAPFAEIDVSVAMTAIPVLTSALASIGRIAESVVDQVHQSIAVLDEKLDVLYRDTSGAGWLTDWLRGRWQSRDDLAPFANRCRALLAGERGITDIVLPISTGPDATARVSVEIRRIERPDSARLVLLLRPAEGIECRQVSGSGLSPREREVARLLALGASHAEVAARLSVSVHTVAHHAGAVYRKTRAGNRTALAARAAVHPPSASTIAALTDRELQIATLLRDGSSNKEIAGGLGLSPATVSNHLQKIYRKLDVHDRVALIRRLST